MRLFSSVIRLMAASLLFRRWKSLYCNPKHGSVIARLIDDVKTVVQLQELHSHLLKLPNEPFKSYFVFKLLTKLLIQISGDNLRYAHLLFDEMPLWKRNSFLWTSLIRTCVQNSYFLRSVLLYFEMHQVGVWPYDYTFSSVLSACARLPATCAGMQVHKTVVQSGFLANKMVVTTLLDMYAKNGFLMEARCLFDSMHDDYVDVVAYTAMICGYTKAGFMEEAQNLFIASGKGNIVSWTTMVAGYANSGDMNSARKLFDLMAERNAITWVAMIAGYGKCGNVEEARWVFDGIAGGKDAACWAAMVACYSQNGYFKEVIELYQDMLTRRIPISEVAMVGVISTCTSLGNLELGKSMVAYIEKGCYERTCVVSSALVHMYAKFGCLEEALAEFNRALDRDTVSYTSLISCFADNGKIEEALQLFGVMLEEGIEPNAITFVSVLNACSHGGLIEQGCKYFSLMIEKFHIRPSNEHLGCLVDLLARAGQLENACEVIRENGSEAANATIWGAILGACKLHGNVVIAEEAASRLFDLEDDDSGSYLLLANTYASTCKWNEVERARMAAKNGGLRKSRGCSWTGS